MTQERPHRPGGCWCELSHHCHHIIPGADGTQEVCCWCGDISPIIKLPTENHGPWAFWLYSPQKVNPAKDICPGFHSPPDDWPAPGTVAAPAQVMH